MDSYKLEMLKKEFPFLSEVAEKLRDQSLGSVSNISIVKADNSLMEQEGYKNNYISYGFFDYLIDDYQLFFAILDQEGPVLALSYCDRSDRNIFFRKLFHKLFHKLFYGAQEYCPQTVAQWLDANHIKPLYVVECSRTIQTHKRTWKIHKMCKFDTDNYLKNKQEDTKLKLAAEIAVVS